MTTVPSAGGVSARSAADVFTTYEKLETMPLMVIKKDNSRETYDRSKIESGVIRSCHKRPVSTQQIDSMIDEIENQIFNMEEREVSTNMIGELVMERLKELDEVAYVRFASVYREFKDVNTFMEELGKLLKSRWIPCLSRFTLTTM